MKILQINSHYNQGGAARIVACIHRQLLEDGEESYKSISYLLLLGRDSYQI